MVDSKYQEEFLEREFIGYGFDMPDPKWPGGAKVCVSFVVQYNMGAESNVLEGDAESCADYLEIAKNLPVPERNESSEMMYEFGAREGVPRLLKLFNKYQLPVTWNIFTRALERAPYWVKPILNSGAEMSCGGHRYRDNFYVDPKEEDRLISKSIDTLQELTGDDSLPKGWMVERKSNLSVKLYSLEHASRDLPLVYSSDSCADDLPYWVPSPTKSGGLLMIPYSYDCSDLRFNMRGSGWASPKDWFLHLRDTFDCLYEEAEQGEPKMMTVLIHPHIVGRPNRTFWLEEFVKYITMKPGAWVARRLDIAEHWQKIHPYDAKTAFGQTPVVECGQIQV
ncbi:allantoinase, partial [Tremellales sp. Uapishka_1]